MSDRLFIYGTLLFDEVWSRIVGHDVKKHTACANDWGRYYMKGKLYPGIRYEVHASVEGALVLNLTLEDWDRLDEFEDNFYTRKLISVVDSKNNQIDAYSYVIEEDHYACLSGKPWLINDFAENHLDEFVLTLKDKG